jgi:ABC-type oligopeptide transport system substrate-binding subunit
MPRQKFFFLSIFLVLLSALLLGCSSKTHPTSAPQPETPEKSMSMSPAMTQGEYPK